MTSKDTSNEGITPHDYDIIQALSSTGRGVIEAGLRGHVLRVQGMPDAIARIRQWSASCGPHDFMSHHNYLDVIRSHQESDLLALVQHAWNLPDVYVDRTSDFNWWGVRCPGYCGYMGVGPDSLSALVAALLAAPSRLS